MKLVSPDFKGKNAGHYSPGVVSKGTLYISGQLSIDMDTRLVPEGGVQAHMTCALHNMERVLNEAGLTRDNVGQCRIYISDIGDWDQVNDVYSDFFGSHTPARIIVPVYKLHFGCLVEIEAVAEFPDNGYPAK